jgi:8-oxo-dGTP diphosphatase
MSDNGDRVQVLRAAGGLLWRETASCRELAIIHRTRYGGDWTLPKGKLKQGESWQQAALREVAEETGCEVRLGVFAGATIYPVEGVPKIVLFWNMTPIGKCGFTPSEEVRQLQWLSVEEALEKLSYEGERALVADSLISPKDTGSSKGSCA